jgi:rhodanese-related sulfurtransferase
MAFILANIELFAAFAAVAVLLWLTYQLEGLLGYRSVPPGDAVRLINDGATVLDLRPAADFAAGHLAGAVNLAPDAVTDWLTRQRKARQRPLVLVTAPRQSLFGLARALRGQGVEQLYVLKGGVGGWAQAQLPLVK